MLYNVAYSNSISCPGVLRWIFDGVLERGARPPGGSPTIGRFAPRQSCCMSKGNVHIVDDDFAMCDSLELLLATRGYETRVFRSGAEILQAASFLPFGCLLVDLQMPEMDGLQLLDRLRARAIGYPTVVMTGFGNVSIAVKAMRAGALDFVEKPFSDETIFASIELALAAATAAPVDTGLNREIVAQRITRLSRREHEVMTRLVAGNSNKVAALTLGLSYRTVEIHRARVMEKMQARSLSELVRLAIAAGINPDLN
jgi:two-component system response regulator FixJ